MRRVAVPAIVALLFLVVVPSASASTQRDTWDTSYQLSAADFCGFAVDVHDYGSNNYFHVNSDGSAWAKQWQGTRDYTNPANQATASVAWNWMTTQSVVSGAGTTSISVLITSHGVFRVVAPDGRVVAVNAGQETIAGDRVFDGTDWIQIGDDELVSIRGPHPMDFGTAFCDAISPLLNP